MTTLWVRNILAYGFQIGVLIAGSALLIRLLRVRTPAVRRGAQSRLQGRPRRAIATSATKAGAPSFLS